MKKAFEQGRLYLVFSGLALLVSSVSLYGISGGDYHNQVVVDWVKKHSFQHRVSDVIVTIEPVPSFTNLTQGILGLGVEFQIDGQYQKWFYANGEPVKDNETNVGSPAQKVYLDWSQYAVHGVKGSKDELLQLVNEKYAE